MEIRSVEGETLDCGEQWRIETVGMANMATGSAIE
jgi:hypothetical protein